MRRPVVLWNISYLDHYDEKDVTDEEIMARRDTVNHLKYMEIVYEDDDIIRVLFESSDYPDGTVVSNIGTVYKSCIIKREKVKVWKLMRKKM